VDAVTFTSSSTARNFAEMFSEAERRAWHGRVAVASIGPITAATAAEYGLATDIMRRSTRSPPSRGRLPSGSPGFRSARFAGQEERVMAHGMFRPRRLREKPLLRKLVRETVLSVDDFVYPLFVVHGRGVREPIAPMPGQHRFSVDELVKECKDGRRHGHPRRAALRYSLGEGSARLRGLRR